MNSALIARQGVAPRIENAPASVAVMVVNSEHDVWVWPSVRRGTYSALAHSRVDESMTVQATAQALLQSFFGITGCPARMQLMATRPTWWEYPGWSHLFVYTCGSDAQPGWRWPAGAGDWADEGHLGQLTEWKALDRSTQNTLFAYRLLGTQRQLVATR